MVQLDLIFKSLFVHLHFYFHRCWFESDLSKTVVAFTVWRMTQSTKTHLERSSHSLQKTVDMGKSCRCVLVVQTKNSIAFTTPAFTELP